MVAYYQHNISHWMDGTESLGDGEYRAYHVICELIYLNDGPIVFHESGIAGRCNQHVLAFRRNFQKLVERGKVAIVNGKITNERSMKELGKITEKIAEKKRKTPSQPPVDPPRTPAGPPADPAQTSAQPHRGLADKPLRNKDSVKNEARIDLIREDKTLSLNLESENPSESESTGSRAIARTPRKKKNREPMPEDWRPSERGFAYAAQFGFDKSEIERAASACLNHHRSRGTMIADFEALWRTWIDNEVKFQKRDGARNGKVGELRGGGFGSRGESFASFAIRRAREAGQL